MFWLTTSVCMFWIGEYSMAFNFNWNKAKNIFVDINITLLRFKFIYLCTNIFINLFTRFGDL